MIQSKRGVYKFLERQETARKLKQPALHESKSSSAIRDLSPVQFASAKDALHKELQII